MILRSPVEARDLVISAFPMEEREENL